jgi:hypothetical protein
MGPDDGEGRRAENYVLNSMKSVAQVDLEHSRSLDKFIVAYMSSENESGVQQRPGRVKAPPFTT